MPKQSDSSHIKALQYFACYYVYGFTDNPFQQSSDSSALEELYKTVIGTTGGIIIPSSFHPYQLVNPQGTTVWQAAYAQLHATDSNAEALNAIAHDNAHFVVDPSAAFGDMHVWPDTRLTTDENPVFAKYVPFVIPFLVYRTAKQPEWDKEIAAAMATTGNASAYVTQVTNAIRFMMPAPAFVLGFDEFDEAHPQRVVDNFINCKKFLGT